MAKRDTSVEAFNKIRENGLLSKRRWQVYEYLFKHGPCTAKQVTGNLRHGLQDSGGYNTRLSELRNMGCIAEVGKTTCPESGHTVILWDVTSNIPKKIHKDPLMQKLYDLGFASLDEYFASKLWKNRKIDFYSRHPKTCFVCGATDNIQLHHITYDRIGNESDEDLVPLRKFWHEYIHFIVKKHKIKLEIAHIIAKNGYEVTKIYQKKILKDGVTPPTQPV